MPIQLDTLWDFQNPEASAARFKKALETATGDDALILHTQIARTHSLRKQFDTARALLRALEPELAGAGAEARTRHALELGRTYASAAHPPGTVTPDAAARARKAFATALDTAQTAGLDALAIDAIHMFAFVDDAPAAQLEAGRTALAIAIGSQQPAARRWEASIRNNIGYALHQLGRFDAALDEFQRALALREAGTDAEATRVAHWMVAWTLRSLNRVDEALAIQLRLEAACRAAGQPDPFVFEELEALCRAKGDPDQAAHWAAQRAAIT